MAGLLTCRGALRLRPPTALRLQGWIKGLRIHKENVFLDIDDGSTSQKMQVFLPRDKKPDNLSWGSSVQVDGKLSQTPRGDLELVADRLKVIGECPTEGYPFIYRQKHPPEHLRQYLHLRPRTNYISSILRLRNAACRAIHDYFDSQEYIYIHTPILTANDCEGAGEVFKVDPEKDFLKSTPDELYFNTKAFLTVSGQLHLEAASHGLSRVYSFGPTFRAENSKSRLHLSEFYMVEAETAFVDDLNDVKMLIENLLKYTTSSLLSKSELDLKRLRNDIPDAFNWIDKSFNSISYDEAIHVLEKNADKFETPVKYGEALTKEHELFLVKILGDIPTFVTDWPKDIKPFYMRSLPGDNTKVAALDLLTPITGEVAGGSLRENDLQCLKNKLPSSAMNWYLDLRKYGSSPTGGFGLGFERYLQFICNVTNIKDTIPFPRWPHNCSM